MKIIAPACNKRDLEEFADLVADMEFTWVDNIDQVLDLVLVKPQSSKLASKSVVK